MDIYHMKNKSEKLEEEKMKIRRKAATSHGGFSIPSSSVDIDQYSAAQPHQEQAFFCITPMAYKNVKNSHNPKGGTKFQRTGKDLKLAFPEGEGENHQMDANFLNMMYQRRQHKVEKPKKPLTKIQKKQRHR